VRQRRGHVSLKAETLDALDSIRALGQSYDGIVQELIALWRQNNAKRDTRLKKNG
jgi:hypothetical protein